MSRINARLLMSGADYFDDGFAINAHMDEAVPVDVDKAKAEHAQIQAFFERAGAEVVKVPAPRNCQDGVYAANWGLVVDDKVIMSNLPNVRQAEEDYAERILRGQGKRIVRFPRGLAFSGQGDALPCGRYLFVGSGYRTSPETHPLLARETGLEVVGLQTVPQLDKHRRPVINPVTGWPDSFFYDLDLALAVITPELIAWCPEAILPPGRERIRALRDVETIEVSLKEAVHGFACNLVSTGETVIMSSRAPELEKALKNRKLRVLTPDVTELLKGGGFIRCTSLTLG